MSFNPSIPQPTDIPSESQGQILTNFTQLNTIFSNNHVTFNAAANNGKHTFCQFPEQGAAPATAVNEGAIYTRQGVSAVAELFFRRESSGTELGLTGAPTTTAIVGGTVYGYTTPFGFTVNWGTGVTAGTGFWQVTYAIAFTTVIAVIPTLFTNSSMSGPSVVTNTTCRIHGSIGASVGFIAIGL